MPGDRINSNVATVNISVKKTCHFCGVVCVCCKGLWSCSINDVRIWRERLAI